MFQQEDNKEQSVSIIGISIAKHFFLDIEVASFLAYWAFLHIFACLGYVSVYWIWMLKLHYEFPL